MTDMLNLHVNGEQRRIANGASLADLVRQLELDPAKVAVERNLEVVPRSTYGDVRLSDGDELEIVHFVGGGDDGDSWSVAGKTRSEEHKPELQSLMRISYAVFCLKKTTLITNKIAKHTCQS